ncbi:protein starmaker-like [Papaver somniferum]|uniref:protein starmaker-like n=1 Tax=Papaver somniferum TaxID=3469 RepID=UPI000E6FCA55|nr:protein starmaker-like [Papaver somniferum]
MESSSASNPTIPANSDQYNQAKYHAFSLDMDELMKLRDEVQGEINRRTSEIADRQRENEEKKRREDEEIESLFAAWLPKHYERSDRKTEERSERHQKGPKYGSESDSEADSAAGYEYHVEEVNTSEEGSDAAEDRLRMEKYLHWKLQMKDSSDSDKNLSDASTDDEEEDESDEEDSSSGDGDTSPASAGSSCSERYVKDDDWSYDEEDRCFGLMAGASRMPIMCFQFSFLDLLVETAKEQDGSVSNITVQPTVLQALTLVVRKASQSICS